MMTMINSQLITIRWLQCTDHWRYDLSRYDGDGDGISEYDVQWCDDDGDVNMMLWRWDHNVMMTVMESLYDDDDDDSDGDGISMW